MARMRRAIDPALRGLSREYDFEQGRLAVDQRAFPQAIRRNGFADTERIASVKGQDFPEAVTRRESQNELASQIRVGAGSQAGTRRELLVERGRTFKSGGSRRLGGPDSAPEQPADIFHAGAPQEGARRFLGMDPEKIGQRRPAQACRGGEVRNIGIRCRIAPDPGRRFFEEVFMPFRAAIKKVGAAAMAGAETVFPCFVGCVEEADVFPFRTARRAGRQAVNPGCNDPGQEFAVVGRIAQQKLRVESVVVPPHASMVRRRPVRGLPDLAVQTTSAAD